VAILPVRDSWKKGAVKIVIVLYRKLLVFALYLLMPWAMAVAVIVGVSLLESINLWDDYTDKASSSHDTGDDSLLEEPLFATITEESFYSVEKGLNGMIVTLLLLIGLGITVVASVVTLVLAVGAWRRTRETSYVLNEKYARREDELEQVWMKHSEAEQKVQQLEEQLEEQRSEKLEWKLQQATEELERSRQAYLETQQQIAQQKQESIHQTEQLEQQCHGLEQERQHLMEELERWHGRYLEVQQRAERLDQERSDAELKVQQLTQLRERLLEELGEIGSQQDESTTRRVSQ